MVCLPNVPTKINLLGNLGKQTKPSPFDCPNGNRVAWFGQLDSQDQNNRGDYIRCKVLILVARNGNDDLNFQPRPSYDPHKGDSSSGFLQSGLHLLMHSELLVVA